MGVKGILFLLIALSGVILNFTSHKISEKTKFSELKIKIAALIIVFAAVSLLFIFGK